jgi:poly-gamma-glutamate synthesis protein (capsule biosynthesis protein)
MRQTSRALDEAGIVHAGVGEHRAAARAARFDTDKGRVALISMASTFTPLEAGAAGGAAPAASVRCGPRDPRWSRTNCGRCARSGTSSRRSVRAVEHEPADDELFGVHYKVGDHRGFTYTIDPIDEREPRACAAKQLSDFVIVTIHAHEPGNWSRSRPTSAEAGARGDRRGRRQSIGHGPHQIRIEVYRGKPISTASATSSSSSIC